MSCDPLFFWVLFKQSKRTSKLGRGMLSLRVWISQGNIFWYEAGLNALHSGWSICYLKNLWLVSLFVRSSLVAKMNSQMTKHFHRVLCSYSLSMNAFLFWLFSAQISCCSLEFYWDSMNCMMILFTFFCTLLSLMTGLIRPSSSIYFGLIMVRTSSKSFNSTKYFFKQLCYDLLEVS